jgi:predicted nucleic acid-binding protein
MSFLLDTNILSAHLRRPPGLAHRFMQYAGRLYTSSVVLAELFVWAHNRPDPAKLLTGIDELLFEEVSLLNYDVDIFVVGIGIRRSSRRHCSDWIRE